jgi:PKD repeat protein
MLRNDFDTFDDLVRGKLTSYNEPPDYESLGKIHAKKARITSLYQLYRLMMVLLVAGIGMLVSTLMIQQTIDTETTSTTIQPTNTNMYSTVPSTEFASANSGSKSSINTSNTLLGRQTASKKQESNKVSEQPSLLKINSSSSSNTSHRAKQKHSSHSKPNTAVQKPVIQQASLPENKGVIPTTTELPITPENSVASDSVSKETMNNKNCDVAFDYYGSYTGALTFYPALTGFTTAQLSWDFGDGQTSSEQSPVHKFDHSGSYIVTLVVTDKGKSCVTRVSKEVVLQTKPSPKQSLILSGSLLAGTDMVANGTIEVYTLNTLTAKYNSSFSVKTKADGSFNIPLTAGERYLLKGYPTAANNNYVPTFWGNTTSDNDASEIIINQGEQLDVVGYTIQLAANEQAPSAETETSNQPMSPSENQVVLVDENNHIVGMGHVDQNGNVVAGAGLKPGNYTAVNPTTGKSNPITIGSSGEVSTSAALAPSSDDKVSVFPNPADNMVNFGINSNNNDEAILVVMNVAGFELMRKSIQFAPGFNQLQYDISGFSPGIYYVMVFKGSQQVMSNRVVKMGELSK